MSDAALRLSAAERSKSDGRRQRAAVVAVFFSHGLLFASWTAHIPQVKDHLGLTYSALGFALLGAPLGSVVAMLVCARLLPRLGSKHMVQASLAGYCAAGPLVGLARSLPELFAALFIWGACQGGLDVSMNTQAVTVELAARRPLMSGFHASWSIGAFAGAGIGAVGVAIGVSLSSQLVLLAIPVLLVAGLLTTGMLPDAQRRAARVDASRPTVRLARPVLVLGGIAFATMLCEGASADWASVYLRGTVQAGAAVAGLGYTAFCLTMVVTRLSGNQLAARFPSRRLLPVLAAVGAIGFTAGLLSGNSAGGIAGFGCFGIGLALIIPTVFSAAGRLPGLNSGTGIAMVSACGWAGFVFGPPIIGEVANATTLTAALGLLPLLTACIIAATARTHALRAASPGMTG